MAHYWCAGYRHLPDEDEDWFCNHCLQERFQMQELERKQRKRIKLLLKKNLNQTQQRKRQSKRVESSDEEIDAKPASNNYAEELFQKL